MWVNIDNNLVTIDIDPVPPQGPQVPISLQLNLDIIPCKQPLTSCGGMAPHRKMGMRKKERRRHWRR